MNSDSGQQRLRFLCRIVRKEMASLQATSQRLFPAGSLTVELVAAWIADSGMSERLDAFVARFSRLQDTLGDKLIPALLEHVGEQIGNQDNPSSPQCWKPPQP